MNGKSVSSKDATGRAGAKVFFEIFERTGNFPRISINIVAAPTDMSASLKPKTNWPELARKANYSTAAMAALGGMSTRQLEREFLRRFGQTPEQWINHLRLQEARMLLEEGTSVKIAAVSLGYKHSPSFSRAFKRHFGIAPSQFRANTNIAQP